MIFFRCPPRGNISREEPWAGSAPGGEGAGEGEWTLILVYLVSRSCLLSTIIHSHYILTPHHHPTYYKSSQKTPPGKWAARPGHGEGKWYSLNYEDNISLNFWNDIHRASGIIDKRDKTVSLNKLFWAKKSLGNIAAGSSSYSFNSFCLFS